jgi:hypothetical protein
MFVFDVETLGVDSNSVVLSAALVHFDVNEKPSYQQLLDNACYVKFVAKEQIDMKREVDRGTLEWWQNQHEYVRNLALKPSPDDLTITQGFTVMRDYMNKFPKSNEQTMWARGSLDQMVIDNLARKLDLQPLTGYNMWRDVRTAVDILYGTENGYCGVEYPDFERAAVIKHHPVHDCALDAMMLMYGKQV